MRIDELRLHRLQIPLKEPYKLAFGAVTHFDTILFEVTIGDGRTGIGEATILNGYTDEEIEPSWRLAQEIAAALCALPLEDARRAAERHLDKAPFVTTAFVTAMEMADGYPALDIREPVAVPLLAGINKTDDAGFTAEIERAMAAGYGTLKIKVGFDAEADLARVGRIQKANAGRAKLRIDANQGFTQEEACRFAASLDPDSIELLEQPCGAHDWLAAEAVARVTTVPLMLDESIYTLADIDRAAALGARFVKLKLMKLGSLDRLAEGLQRIRRLGMTPVLGNGVASEIGCWMEAAIARTHIDNAGELNGFLRQAAPICASPLTAARGAVELTPGWRPVLDGGRVAAARVEAHRISAARRVLEPLR